MIKKARPYISFLFLLAFLFPAVLKDIHTLHHEDHELCTVVSDYHFHKHHAECKCCDRIIPVTDTPAMSSFSFSSFQFAEYSYRLFLTSYSGSFIFSYSRLRAPPVAA